MTFFLTQKAKADLIKIAQYTQKVWGIQQRDIYLSRLDRVFHFLNDIQYTGQNCDHIRKGYRKYQMEKHIIFYREIYGGDIEIIRILHERMDIEKGFK